MQWLFFTVMQLKVLVLLSSSSDHSNLDGLSAFHLDYTLFINTAKLNRMRKISRKALHLEYIFCMKRKDLFSFNCSYT